MRRSVTVAAVILVLVLAVGGGCEWANGRLVRKYQLQLLRVGSALAEEQWQAARRSAEQLSADWERESAVVQLWVNHGDTDAVTHALRGLVSAIALRDSLSSLLFYGDCMENFAHLHHRDAFTLKNIL